MEIKIKDFILSEIPTKEKCEPKKRNKTEYCFTLEYENDSDFILKKKSQRSERLLVVLVSQAQFYIKNTKTNEIEKVSDINQIRNFRKGMTSTPKFEKLEWSPFDAYHDYEHFKRLLEFPSTCKEMMNKKVNPFKNWRIFNEYRWKPEQFEKDLPYIRMANLIDDTVNLYHQDKFIPNLRKSNIVYNQIRDNLETIKEIGGFDFINFMNYNQAYLIFSEYLCDFKTFVEYLAYTITHRNGLDVSYYGGNTSFTASDYIDYLEMQQQMYGKIKEKYPENWLSDKHRMNLKYNNWKKLHNNTEFSLHQENLAERVEYENDTFRVIVPRKNVDILDEAEQQRHCVASYIDNVRCGNTHIVFIRLKDTPEESLLTVEINNDDTICQVRGFQNRLYNEVEYDFMEEWANAKNLKLGVKRCQNTDCTN